MPLQLAFVAVLLELQVTNILEKSGFLKDCILTPRSTGLDSQLNPENRVPRKGTLIELGGHTERLELAVDRLNERAIADDRNTRTLGNHPFLSHARNRKTWNYPADGGTESGTIHIRMWSFTWVMYRIEEPHTAWLGLVGERPPLHLLEFVHTLGQGFAHSGRGITQNVDVGCLH